MKSWILFSLVLITKLSLPLIVHPPTSVKVRTLTLYQQNKSSSHQAIFKASGKNPARYVDPSFFVIVWVFFFLSVYLWTSWFSQGAAKVVSKAYCCAISSSNWKKHEEESITGEAGSAASHWPLLQTSPVWAAGQTVGFVHRQLGHIAEDFPLPCHVSTVFLSSFCLVPTGCMAQGLQDLAGSLATSALTPQRPPSWPADQRTVLIHHRVFEGEAYYLWDLPVTGSSDYIHMSLDSMRRSSEAPVHVPMALC